MHPAILAKINNDFYFASNATHYPQIIKHFDGPAQSFSIYNESDDNQEYILYRLLRHVVLNSHINNKNSFFNVKAELLAESKYNNILDNQMCNNMQEKTNVELQKQIYLSSEFQSPIFRVSAKNVLLQSTPLSERNYFCANWMICNIQDNLVVYDLKQTNKKIVYEPIDFEGQLNESLDIFKGKQQKINDIIQEASQQLKSIIGTSIDKDSIEQLNKQQMFNELSTNPNNATLFIQQQLNENNLFKVSAIKSQTEIINNMSSHQIKKIVTVVDKHYLDTSDGCSLI